MLVQLKNAENNAVKRLKFENEKYRFFENLYRAVQGI